MAKTSKAKSKSNKITWGDIAHSFLNILMPIAIVVLVQRDLTPFAVLLVILSKWRIFAVQPRHWFANLRANSTDMIFGLSIVAFMYQASQLTGVSSSSVLVAQSVWALVYIVWLVFIKPKSSEVMVGVQALLAQILGFTALFWFSSEIPETLLIIASWLIAVSTARHFISSYEEPLIRVLSFAWGLFIVQMAWLLNRWLTVYPIGDFLQIPQIAVLVGALGYLVGTIYHLKKNDKLTKKRVRSYFIFGCAILLLVIGLTDWTGEI